MVVSYQTLVTALEKVGYAKEVSADTAGKLMDFIGLYGTVNDRNISKDMRTIFYELEKNKIVFSEIIETKIPAGKFEGRPYRLYFWVLNEDYVKQLAKPAKKHVKDKCLEQDFEIYSNDEMWNEIQAKV